jgi:hypothetical protein
MEEGHKLLLHAEMRAPGRAWLELSVEPADDGSRYTQRAIFFPRGLPGRLYWWGVWPFHGFIFPSMARNILATAAALEEPGPGAPEQSTPADQAAARITPAAETPDRG